MELNIREYLSSQDESIIVLDGYDECIIGIVDGCACYSVNKIIKKLMEEMSLDEALQYFEYNIEGMYLGEYTPKYLFELPNVVVNHLTE